MKLKVGFFLSAVLVSVYLTNAVHAEGVCQVSCNCNNLLIGGTPPCDPQAEPTIVTCTTGFECEGGSIEGYRAQINAWLVGKCGDETAVQSIGCDHLAPPMTCARACISAPTTNLTCGGICISDDQCASGYSCYSDPPVKKCRNPTCLEDSSCTCGTTEQRPNSCRVTCDVNSGCGTVTKASCVGTCMGTSDESYKEAIFDKITAAFAASPQDAVGCTRNGTEYTCTDDCSLIVDPGGGLPLGTCKSEDTKVTANCGTGRMPQITDTGPNYCICVDANEALTELFNIINGIMIPLTIIAGFFLIVLAGYKILKSQGNPQELQTGKDNLTSAIIGLIFVLMAVSILRVIIKALITGNADPF